MALFCCHHSKIFNVTTLLIPLHCLVQEKEEQKKKFEQFQKLMEFHKEQHKRVADMMKWNALMKLHAEV